VFEQARSGSSWLGGLLVVGAVGLGLGAWWRPDLLDVALQQVDLASRGIVPGTSLWASERVDYPVARSPLEVALALEGAWVTVDPAQGLALADRVATDAGRWMLQQTAAGSVEEAEQVLWSRGEQDQLFVFVAQRLREEGVHARKRHRLSEPEDEGQPVYVHPDDLAWIIAHVAWRLDLRVELVRSPVHHYLVAREPGGEGARTVEATCFRRVDALGQVVQSDQPSVGRRFMAPEAHYPSGVGGIRHVEPLPEGAYRSLRSEEAVAEAIMERLTARHGEVELSTLCPVAASHRVRVPPCIEEAP